MGDLRGALIITQVCGGAGRASSVKCFQSRASNTALKAVKSMVMSATAGSDMALVSVVTHDALSPRNTSGMMTL